MNVAILSDIHGNLEALEVVLDDVARHAVRRIIFLGDVVGYGADPKACIDLIRKHASIMILGNHDYAVINGDEAKKLNPDALFSILWSIDHIKNEYESFIKLLPYIYADNHICATHASPLNPQIWDYILTREEAVSAFSVKTFRVLFIGHSHCPCIFVEKEQKRMFTGELSVVEELNPDNIVTDIAKRYIINPGSVGQPRDGDPRASYGIYDDIDGIYNLRRVEYDIDKASKKIKEAGLPDNLADRLYLGK